MDVLTVGALRAAAFVFHPRDGSHALAVVAKITLSLTPDVCKIAPAQEDVRDDEKPWEEGPDRSVYAPSDVAPFKRRAEVLLVGSAFAPGGRAVKSLTARLAVGALEKAIEVHGPRLFTPDDELVTGAPWKKMPLQYERAAGGPDTWNPVGVWLDGPRDSYGQKRLPNLQPRGVELRDPGQFVPPVGFGPISATWPLRAVRRRGRADVTTPLDARDTVLGDDLDPAFFQDAPEDQQLPSLRGDEAISLENLHPERETFTTRLPGIRPQATFEAPGEGISDVPLTADTLWIDTDRLLCTLTFRGQIPLADPAIQGRVRVRMADPAAPRPREEEPPSSRVSAAPPSKAPPPPPVADPETDDSELEVYFDKTQPNAKIQAPPLPFSGPSPTPYLPPPKLQAGSPSPRTHRSMTTEMVIPPGALAGPSWLAPSERPSSPPPPPVAPMSIATRSNWAPSPQPAQAQPPPLAPTSAAPAHSAPPGIPRPPMITLSALGAGQAPSRDLPRTPPPETTPLQRPSAPPAEPRPASGDRAGGPPSLLSASNTASASWKKETARSAHLDPVEAKADSKPDTAGYIEILSFERSVLPRLRAHKVFGAWIRPPENNASPAQAKAPSEDPSEKADRADVHKVLCKDPSSAADAAASAEDDDEPSLVFAQGTLAFSFDEIEVLRAAISAAKPLASLDRKLKEAIDLGAELLRAEADGGEPAEPATARIRDAWSRANRTSPAGHLDARIEQKLLESRKYQRRVVLDGEWIRALFTPSAGEPVVAYLPLSLEKRLPLFARLPVKLLAELYPPQDPTEKSGVALKIVALARTAPRPRLGK